MKKIFVLLGLLLIAGTAGAATRTVSWTAVTTYADNNSTPIESTNLPVTDDIWYVDSVTGTKTAIASGVTGTSYLFSDAGMVKGRIYNVQGKAYVKDGSGSADSAPYTWTVPFQIPKAPSEFTVQ